MKRACVLAVALTLAATLPRAAAPAITIDASTSAGKVSPLLYGLMTEESRSRTLYVKLVNPGSAAAPVQFDVTGATLRPTATCNPDRA